MPIEHALSAPAGSGLTVIVDPRYVHPAVSLGWRQAHVPAGNELRAAIENVVLRNPSLTDSLSFDWEIEDGADIFTALLPQHSAGSWTRALLGTAMRGGVHRPVASIVGSREAAVSVRSVWCQMRHPAPRTSTPFPSFMTQARAGGRTTVTVTGRDPVEQWGSAATALASHLAQTRLPHVELSTLAPNTFHMMRHLHEATPAVSWRIRAAQRRGLLLLEEALDELTSHRRSRDGAALARARFELEHELQEHRRSPVQFARTLTRHAVMGWGAELVQDPGTQLGRATAGAVDAAYLALLRPIAEVLGQT